MYESFARFYRFDWNDPMILNYNMIINNNYDNQMSEDNNNYYYMFSIDNYDNSTSGDSNNMNFDNKNIFNESEILTKQDSKIFGLKKRKKPGSQKKENNDLINYKKQYTHTKLKFDNILAKVQRSYINFLIEFINTILSSQWRKDLKFLFINSKIKKINKIEKRQELKEQSIGDIIKNEISDKYKNYDKNHNLNLYQELQNEGMQWILDILDKKFLFFFENIYYKSQRKINLKDFGLIDLDIELPSKIELYNDLLNKNKNYFNFDKYKAKMESCVKRHFLGGLEEENSKNGIF